VRVAIASIVFPHPRSGVFAGIERLLEGYVAALVAEGHQVTVFTSFWNGGNSEDSWGGARVLRFEDSGHRWGKLGRVLDLHYVTWSRNVTNAILADSRAFDVVHAISPLYDTPRLRRAVVPVVHSFYHYDLLREARQVLYLPVHHAIERRAYRASERVVAIWNHGGHEVAQRFGLEAAKVRVVQLGIDLPATPPNIERKGESLLFVGNLEKRKGLDVLLRALALLPVAVTLDVVGHGTEEAQMRALADELGVTARVRFLGFVDEPTLDALYRKAAIFVFPSLQVAGFVLWEAMARGCPVLATNVGGTAEIVGSGAILVPPSDPEALASAAGMLLRDPTARFALATRALDVPRKYSWKTTAIRMRSIYEEAIRSAASRKEL